MAESIIHMNYVRRIADYIRDTFPECNPTFLDVSLPDSSHTPSQVMDGPIPDVWYDTEELCIIGEAKTYDDVEKKHTYKQIEAYINELRLHTKASKHLVLCTSMYKVITFMNIASEIRRIASMEDIKIHAMDDVEKIFVI